MQIDHVVLWVADPMRSVEFYSEVVGLEPVRVQEFAEGKASFPSVRVNANTILDLMDASKIEGVRSFTGSNAQAGGTPINHLCLSMMEDECDALLERLAKHGIATNPGGEASFGAQGDAKRSVYWNDPDGNVIEVRHYE